MVWNADPILFSLGPLTIRWYGLMFIVGFLIGYEAMKRIFRRDGYPLDILDSLLVHLMLGTIIGARLGHCLFYEPVHFLTHPLEILEVWKGGLASHGGFLGVFIALWLFSRKNQIPLMYLLDKIGIFALLAGAFIRIGNFMNSEILGRPTTLPWGVVFSRVDQIARHPTPLYESLAYFAISLTAWRLESRSQGKQPRGFCFGFILLFGFLARFVIEFFKENQEAFEQTMPINMGQLLSLIPIAAGIYLLIRARKLGPWPTPTMLGTKNSEERPKKKKKQS